MTALGKAIAYHGIDKAAYAIHAAGGAAGTPVPALYAKSIAYNPVFDSQEVFADNRLLLRIPTDQGDEGSFGTTAQDVAFEEALGLAVPVEGGMGVVGLQSYTRFDFYYEYIAHPENGPAYKVKAWLLNVECSRPGMSNQTDQTTATIGEYSYPLRVYGMPLLEATGDKEYRDTLGLGRTLLRVISLPGDTGYATFGGEPPEPRIRIVSGG